MNKSQLSGQLSWLQDKLKVQRNNIAKTLLVLRGIGVRAGTSLFLRQSFTRFLEQVEVEKEKELGLLHEIDAIERQHDHLRKHKLLRRADPDLAPRPDPYSLAEIPEEPPTRDGIGNLFGLLTLFSAFRINQKNQRLTAD